MNPQVVQFVLDRDEYQCVICGSDYLIQIAHRYSRGSRPDLKNDPDNLCVLCYNCHIIRQHTQGTLKLHD